MCTTGSPLVSLILSLTHKPHSYTIFTRMYTVWIVVTASGGSEPRLEDTDVRSGVNDTGLHMTLFANLPKEAEYSAVILPLVCYQITIHLRLRSH